jgi:hypothetical protein
VIDELCKTAPGAIDRTLAGLPAGFPNEIAQEIADVARQRIAWLPSS